MIWLPILTVFVCCAWVSIFHILARKWCVIKIYALNWVACGINTSQSLRLEMGYDGNRVFMIHIAMQFYLICSLLCHQHAKYTAILRHWKAHYFLLKSLTPYLKFLRIFFRICCRVSHMYIIALQYVKKFY